MKKLLLLILLMGVSMYSQQDNDYTDLRATIDPYVAINEGNLNLKLEVSSHFNGHHKWRANAMIEILTGHNYGSSGIGYWSGEVGVGYSIPYNISKLQFQIEPGINIGFIHRPNMPTSIYIIDKIRYEENRGYWGFSHSLNLRHKLQIGEIWGIYIHNRLLHRPDLHFEQTLTATPNKLPYYNIDNAVGVYFIIK